MQLDSLIDKYQFEVLKRSFSNDSILEIIDVNPDRKDFNLPFISKIN